MNSSKFPGATLNITFQNTYPMEAIKEILETALVGMDLQTKEKMISKIVQTINENYEPEASHDDNEIEKLEGVIEDLEEKIEDHVVFSDSPQKVGILRNISELPLATLAAIECRYAPKPSESQGMYDAFVPGWRETA